MAVKKKIKIKRMPSAVREEVLDQDYMMSGEKSSDGYTVPSDITKAAENLKMSNLNFKDELEMQAFMKMTPEEQKAFAMEREKRRRKIKPGSSELQRREMMSQGL